MGLCICDSYEVVPHLFIQKSLHISTVEALSPTTQRSPASLSAGRRSSRHV